MNDSIRSLHAQQLTPQRSTPPASQLNSPHTYHFYNGNRLATRLNTQGCQRVIWALNIGVAQGTQVSGTWHNQMLQTDQQGSALGSFNDEYQGTVYTPYGHRFAAESAPLLGFTGQWIDPISGTYPLGNGHRFYHPQLRRFSSPDALSPFGKGGFNAYAYCAGDPINSADPTGRWTFELYQKLTTKGSSVLQYLVDNPEQRLHAIGFGDGKTPTAPKGYNRTYLKYDAAEKRPRIKSTSKLLQNQRQIPTGHYYTNEENSVVILGFGQRLGDPDASLMLSHHDTLVAAGFNLQPVNTYDEGSLYQTPTGIKVDPLKQNTPNESRANRTHFNAALLSLTARELRQLTTQPMEPNSGTRL
ncbi:MULTISPECIES: RHS repeat-associated core domain-containing protein [unclassified Pseudomonas]|jgi:RHS repeat-associated core domain|uniref:RHS repeat-associated core domain-containing protein n=1 Tax=unclassified Pseudomonas TaxID=196821 RepID=UPI000402ACD6|nr:MULTISPECIES: RHS repeat-associated core domain-containing protein [unclassified Pseudomonas]SMF31635.1 RHS repeat-associated core domain-containing protein [Pseudomonas sp. LAIL14HWK12:I11]SMR78075.1 RHS repeat-associated core domain-containing protein [Pseudomonas sp. LAIL14HWK12:I10]SOD04373.1 RHS repeat-associated core domain-containing protein [Pseudomonas sp. LAIL14HWK12:I8]